MLEMIVRINVASLIYRTVGLKSINSIIYVSNSLVVAINVSTSNDYL